MNHDADLLLRYTRTGDNVAFAEVVRRRVGLVYAVALRRTGDADRARDAAQAVFIRLARDAAKLAQHPALVGWLYRSAYNAATDIVRAEAARAIREREAQAMHELDTHDSTEAEQLKPLLDRAMLELDDADRDALLLRFFDQQAFAEIGRRLRLTESAARMRVQRALEKLRAVLERRGIATTAGALAAAVEAHAASTVVPAGLTVSITGAVSAAGIAPAAGLVFLTLKTMSVLIGAAFLAAGSAWLLTSQNDTTPVQSSVPPVATTPVAPPTVATQAPKAHTVLEAPVRRISALERGERALIVEMQDQGNATPRAAMETFLWAQETGNIDRLAMVLHLTPGVQVEAEKLFAALRPDQQAYYGSPLRLTATFFSGGGAIRSKRQVESSPHSYQILREEAGVKMPPLALGLGEDCVSDVTYQTLRSHLFRMDGTTMSRPVWVFHRTADGWRYVPPAGQVETFGHRLKNGPTKAK